MTLRHALAAASLVLVPFGAAACVQDDPPPLVRDAVVDTGTTLTEPPGTGAGVFVEYQPGGHWHLWWTCDTKLSGLPCTFYVDAIASTGAITNVTGDQLESDDSISTPASDEVSLTTDTTTGVDGVFFDTTPGATINLLQQIGSTQDGTFFLWGATGGGVEGGGDPPNVADPLNFTPSSP
jgi:hypothetical protein